jgi:TP901 family phage tail tape measure protein
MTGTAVWLDVLPSMGKFAPNMTKGAVAAGKTSGLAAGKAYSASLAAGAKGGAGATALVSELEVAAKKAARIVQNEKTAIYAARNAEKAATQALTAAETSLSQRRLAQQASASQLSRAELTLANTRDRYGASSVKTAKAEEALNVARAKAQGASAAVMRSEGTLTTARGRSEVLAMKTVAVEDQLRAAFNEQKVVTAQLGEVQGAAAKRTALLNGGLSKMAAAGAPVSAGFGKIAGGIKQTTGAAIGLLAPLASMAAGFGAIIGIGKVVSLGNEYTRTMNEFQAVTNSTDQAMQAVRQTSRDLGSDLTLPATSGADAAAIMVELAKGGFSAQQSMEAAKGTITLAAAAQIEGARAAEIQSAALNQFGLRATEASRVSDILANTANAAAGGVEEIGLALKYTGPTARALGIDIVDTASAIGILANNGIKADNAGTALRGMMASLAAPSKKAGGAIEALGVSAFDSEGNFVGMRTVIDQLSQAQKNMTKEQFTANAAIAFGREPLSAVTALASSGAAAYDDMTLAVSRQGGASEVAQSQMKGLGGAMDKLESQLEDVALTIYDTVAPGITYLVDGVASKLDGASGKVSSFLKTAGGLGKLAIGGDFTSGLSDGLGWQEDSIPVDMILTARDKVIAGFRSISTFVTTQLVPSLKNIAVAVAPIAAVLAGVFLVAWESLGSLLVNVVGPALVAVTGFLSENQWVVAGLAVVMGVLTASFYAQKASLAVLNAGGMLAFIKNIAVVRNATAVWTAAQWALNIAMAANPVGLIIVGVAALIAAIVLAYNNVGWFRDGVNAAFAGIMVAVRAVGDAGIWLWENALKPAWNAIAGAAVWLYQTILKPAFDGIVLVVSAVGAAVSAYIGAMVRIFQAVAAAGLWLYQTILKPVFDGIAVVAGFMWSVVSAIFDLIVHVVRAVVGVAFSWLYNNVIRPVFVGIQVVLAAFWVGAQVVFNAVVGFIRGTLGVVFSWLYTNIIQPVFSRVAQTLSAFWIGAQIIFGAVVGFLRNTLGPVFTWLYNNAIRPAWDGIRSTIETVWGIIRPVFDRLASIVKEDLPQAFELGKKAIGRAWDGLKDIAKAPIRFVVDTVINDGLIGNFNKVADFFGSKKIPKIRLPKGFASGGILPGQSRMRDGDDQLVPMRRGEGVLVSEGLRTAADRQAFMAANAAGRQGVGFASLMGGGYAQGGIVGNVIDWVKDKATTAYDFVSDPKSMLAKAVNGLVSQIPGAGGMLELAKGASSKLIDGAIGALRKIGETAMPAAGPAGVNGRLSAGMLAPVASHRPGPGVGPMGGMLRRDAAMAWGRADSAFRASGGGSLTLTEGYRSFADQVMRWNAYRSGRGNLAATPGTSNHGYGLAADIAANGQGWLAANGPRFGWYPTGLGFSQREPWHFDYKGKGGGGGLAEGGIVTPTLYDTGGMLNEGTTVISKKTKSPEYALPEEKLIRLMREAVGSSDAPQPLIGGDLVVQGSGNLHDDLTEVDHKLRAMRRGGPKK